MIRRINIGGSPNLGVSISATEKIAITPPNILDGMVDLITECLDVPVIKTPISGSNLTGGPYMWKFKWYCSFKIYL